jgi:hypothetical protein
MMQIQGNGATRTLQRVDAKTGEEQKSWTVPARGEDPLAVGRPVKGLEVLDLGAVENPPGGVVPIDSSYPQLVAPGLVLVPGIGHLLTVAGDGGDFGKRVLVAFERAIGREEAVDAGGELVKRQVAGVPIGERDGGGGLGR